MGQLLHVPATAATGVGALLCFGLRLIAIHRGWHLPVAKRLDQPATSPPAPKDRKDAAQGASEISMFVPVCGKVFDGLSDALTAPAGILGEGNRIAKVDR
jgi:hypothetical protein